MLVKVAMLAMLVPAPAVIDAELVRPTLTEHEAPESVARAWFDLQAGRPMPAIEALVAFAMESPAHPLAPAALMVAADAAEREGEPGEAALLFAVAAPEQEILRDAARSRGARAAMAAGEPRRALALAEAISPSGGRWWAALKIRVRALRRLHRPAEAVALLRGVKHRLARTRARWRDAQLAAALGATGERFEAARRYRRLALRYPRAPVAKLAEQRLRALRRGLSRAQWHEIDAGEPADLLAEAWARQEKRQPEEAIELARTVVAQATPGDALWCEARWLLGEAWTALRAHGEAAMAFAAYGDTCADDRAAEALYRAGRAFFNDGADAMALDALGQMGTIAPGDSHADDALFVSARILEDSGRHDAAHRVLDRLLTDHPEGDRAADAHWRLFAWRLRTEGPASGGDADVEAGARTERALSERGRLRYFRARALEGSGRLAAATDLFLRVVEDAPMGYYGLLALNRLRTLDPEAAQGLLDAAAHDLYAQARRPEIRPPGVEREVDFREGLALLRLGLFADAWRAFRRIEGRFAAPDRYRQTVAELFAEAGADRFARNVRRRISHLEAPWPVAGRREAFEVVYPRAHTRLIARWADARGVPPALVYALIREESRFRPKVVSRTRACGLMQLMVPTARELARADGLRGRITCRGLQRPALNIRLGTRFLADLLALNGGHLGLAIATYHAGYGNMRRWLEARADLPFDAWVEAIPFVQTRRYIKRGLATLWVYQWLLADDDAPVLDRVPVVPLSLDGRPETLGP